MRPSSSFDRGASMDSTGVIDVFDVEGVHLVMDAASESAAGHEGQAELSLDDGQRVLVPATLLHKREDGTYYLPLPTSELRRNAGPAEGERGAEEGGWVLPIVEESLDVHKQAVSKRVLVHKNVREREVVVEEPTLREDVEIERVPINRQVDGPIPARHEGDVLVVPLLEEVLVVEKRLMLREELRITRHRTQVSDQRRETLRAEEVSVERLPGGRSHQVNDEPAA